MWDCFKLPISIHGTDCRFWIPRRPDLTKVFFGMNRSQCQLSSSTKDHCNHTNRNYLLLLASDALELLRLRQMYHEQRQDYMHLHIAYLAFFTDFCIFSLKTSDDACFHAIFIIFWKSRNNCAYLKAWNSVWPLALIYSNN